MLVDKKILGKVARLESTYDALRFASLATVSMEMAETREHFRTAPDNNPGLDWQSITSGQRWGDSWWSAWFRGKAIVPAGFGTGRLFLRARTGAPECLMLIDGCHQGVFDVNHPVRLVDLYAEEGNSYQIHLEGYAGHSFPGTQPFDEPHRVAGGAPQDDGKIIERNARAFEGVWLVTEREDVSRFVFELRALRQLAAVLDEHSLRKGRIQTALQEVFALVYAKPEEVCEKEWREQLNAACAVMRPLLELNNSATAPVFGIIGHSHIDSAWLWTLAETDRKLSRTFSSVLSLMDQYPEFRFTQSAAYHSDVVRRLYPELFSRIAQRVREGRWEINGAMWIEPDCNIPSGESLVRQCLVGQRATREMFGVTSDTLWQPDVFGYSAALPQILQGCDVRYFCTTKLGWNDTNPFPYDTFVWQGMDGSSVVAHFNRIHCSPDPETLTDAWRQVQHNDVQDRRLITFGYGDGGGGPTAEMIEIARRVEDLEGCPRVEYKSVSAFMEGVSRDLIHLPRWTGELYLELHRGTLTSLAKLKRGNRQSEFALRSAEFAAALAHLVTKTVYPADDLLDLWKILLLNQFHDILPGTSIAEVNDEATAAFATCLKETNALRDRCLQSLTEQGSGTNEPSILLANDLSWERFGDVVLTGLPTGMRPSAGGIVQEIEDVKGQKSLIVADLHIPALGYRTIPLQPRGTWEGEPPFHIDGDVIETPHARIRLNEAGQVVSFFDRKARRELVANGGVFNELLMGEDVPALWDNWDIDRDQRLKMMPQNTLLRRTVVADGPLQLRIRQEYRIGQSSTLVQDMVFHANTPQVDFDTVVDWREKYQFLKVGFALDVLADSARHEIQFGHLMRSTHDNTRFDRAQFDVCAHKWTDISETGYGVAFLNDCKYACTVKGNKYHLSLLKSGRHPDPRGDEGSHRFAYALLPHEGGFSVESVVRPAYEFNTRVSSLTVASTADKEFGLVTVDAANVIIESVKWSESGEGFILRLYEAGKTGTHVNLAFGLSIAEVNETNLLEENPRPLEITDNGVSLYLRPFEIKTLRCRPV